MSEEKEVVIDSGERDSKGSYTYKVVFKNGAVTTVNASSFSESVPGSNITFKKGSNRVSWFLKKSEIVAIFRE
ncbi:TPA: hypothetical protein P0E24_004653 [Vibrio campbellii]|uniref:hypothetical protein n=1 Tax=Vibrio sp. M260121 TaxID=3020897 RepID=UPI0011A5E950|nr:hypothetical protein [Vibrio campbellii]HDM8245491.1 hypothetical protein [Vibrio campbellii]